MKTEDALRSVSEIRQRLLLTDARHSVRCLSLYVSAAIFVIAAAIAPGFVEPSELARPFAGYWLVVGLLVSGLVVGELTWRCRSGESRITHDWVRQLLSSMMPALAAAGLITWGLVDRPLQTGMLPGLWAIMAGLAIASARRSLPRACQFAAIWWVVAGAVALRCESWVAGNSAISIAIIFGVGQLVLARCLMRGIGVNHD